jgi:hypothetical protein
MDQFKIDNFRRDHPGTPFPQYRTLTPEEAQEVRSRLCGAAGLDPLQDPLSILKALDRLAEPIPGLNAQEASFDCEAALRSRRVLGADTVYVNWDRFRVVDRIGWRDLVRYFSDLWYPSSDDIEVFDDSMAWVLLVAHHGGLKLATSLGAPRG